MNSKASITRPSISKKTVLSEPIVKSSTNKEVPYQATVQAPKEIPLKPSLTSAPAPVILNIQAPPKAIQPPTQLENPKPIQKPIEEKKPTVSICNTDRLTVNLGFRAIWHKQIHFPVKGMLTTESHYLNTLDSKHVRKNSVDSISDHLKNSCKLYNNRVEKVECSTLYRASFVRQWTPSEGGNVGSGSISQSYQQQYLTPWMEMWMATMMWNTGQDRPQPGEKFLIINPENNKKVVVQMGFETGPSKSKWIGGIVPEVGFYLRSDNTTVLKVYHLTDKTTQLGPTNCEINQL